MEMERKLISIVVPFYNEGEGVDAFYRAVSTVLDRIDAFRFEVVCIDDGSRDDTLQRLISLIYHDSRFQVIELSRNFGKESALTAGIDASEGDAVIPFDADLQDPADLIPALIEEWQKGADVVLARRSDRSSDSYLKRKTARMFYRFHNRLAEVKLPENVGDFRLMDRAVVESLKKLSEKQRFMKGLFAWVGFKTTTVDYTRNPRVSGRTKFSGWKLWNFALEGITSFSTFPLRMWTYIGGLGAIMTLCYALFLILKTVISDAVLSENIFLTIAVLFFGSLQLIGIGILGEYMGRTYMETKQRPTYLIRRHHRVKKNNDV